MRNRGIILIAIVLIVLVAGTMCAGASTKESIRTPAATLDNVADGISISWDIVLNADGYKVYRQTETGKWKLIRVLKNKNSTNYISHSSSYEYVSGKYYRFRVLAYNSYGSSKYCECKTKYIDRPAIKVKSTGSGTMITWKAVEGAQKYKVYRKENGHAEYTLISTVSKQQYLDKSADCEKVYRYRVRAFGSGYQSAVSRTIKKSVGVHNYTSKKIAATCESKGYVKYTCIKCGKTYKGKTIYHLPHSFTQWKTVIQPSATSEGLMERKCVNCGLIVSAPVDTGSKIINCAVKYVGGIYMMGGDSFNEGIDCSHFVNRVLGESIGYTGGWQLSFDWINSGKAVETGKAKAGDIIVFNGHVVFYMGNNRIVHAFGANPYPSGGIRIQQFDSFDAITSYFENEKGERFLGIRRFED